MSVLDIQQEWSPSAHPLSLSRRCGGSVAKSEPLGGVSLLSRAGTLTRDGAESLHHQDGGDGGDDGPGGHGDLLRTVGDCGGLGRAAFLIHHLILSGKRPSEICGRGLFVCTGRRWTVAGAAPRARRAASAPARRAVRHARAMPPRRRHGRHPRRSVRPRQAESEPERTSSPVQTRRKSARRALLVLL